MDLGHHPCRVLDRHGSLCIWDLSENNLGVCYMDTAVVLCVPLELGHFEKKYKQMKNTLDKCSNIFFRVLPWIIWVITVYETAHLESFERDPK